MFNPPESEFSKLDFNKADWANLRADISSLSFVDVYSSMNAIDVNVSKVIETIGHCCMLIVPLKFYKEDFIKKISKTLNYHYLHNIHNPPPHRIQTLHKMIDITLYNRKGSRRRK